MHSQHEEFWASHLSPSCVHGEGQAAVMQEARDSPWAPRPLPKLFLTGSERNCKEATCDHLSRSKQWGRRVEVGAWGHHCKWGTIEFPPTELEVPAALGGCSPDQPPCPPAALRSPRQHGHLPVGPDGLRDPNPLPLQEGRLLGLWKGIDREMLAQEEAGASRG